MGGGGDAVRGITVKGITVKDIVSAQLHFHHS